MLKQIKLRNAISKIKGKIAIVRKKSKEFEKRQKEIEQARNEALTEEELTAVEETVDQLEADITAFEEEVKETEAELQDQINKLEEQINAIEEEGNAEDVTEEAQLNSKREINRKTSNVIGDNRKMRTKAWGNMTRSQTKNFVERQEIKDFLQRVRNLGLQTRAITGAELTIPDNVLEILRDNTDRYSKLIGYVKVRPIKGTARQTIAPDVVEGIWTEMCGTLNELSFKFSQVEMDGYKVGGYIAICNATLADSDLNLMEEILDSLGQAIGYAIDKAIIYGKGTKMPLGIVTRLAQTTKPTDWSDKAPEWKDLHETNILKISSASLTDIKLFQEFVKGSGAAKSKYSTGVKFWAMNETTWTTLQSKLLSINAAGALVSAMEGEGKMPIVGGEIVLLDFIQDGDVIGGYGSIYVLAEREGAQFAQSEHVQFIEDNTVFKGTARYDGMPIFGESFMAININAIDVTTEMSFAIDTANP